MKLKLALFCIALVVAPWARGQETSTQLDLRKAVPGDVHMAVYGKHNAERDYQKEYLAQVWQTVQNEKIGERILGMITSRVPQEQIDQTKAVIDELRAAIDPTLSESILDCQEVVYAQRMEFPTNNHLVLLRYPAGVAEKIETSVKNLLALLEKKSEGKVPMEVISHGDVEVTGLKLPPDVPFGLAFARLDDVFVLSTSRVLLSQSLEMLQNGSGNSKFDDPRFAEAFAQLPAAEDAIVIFDAQELFEQVRKVGDYIRRQAKDNPDAEKGIDILNLVLDEVDVVEYEVSVEYTEGYQNRSMTLGKVLPHASEKMLGKMVMGGEAFDDWQSWIPADAEAYSLNKGVRLHPVYERVMEIVQEKFPESKEALDKFAALQDQWDLHIDQDILQSISGETVSLALPGADQGQDTVFALKCTNPDKINELLHRLVDAVNKLPAMASQQIALNAAEGLDGFETLNVPLLAAFEVKPVIGFDDDWLIVGSNPACVQKVLDTRAGKSPTIDGSAHFERFDLEVEGPVDALYYTDLKKATHNVADMIRKVGGIAPMIMAMAGANANPEDMKPVFEALALLPSIANVVERFDYYEASLTVVQPGPLSDTYLKQSVTLIRPPVVAAKD